MIMVSFLVLFYNSHFPPKLACISYVKFFLLKRTDFENILTEVFKIVLDLLSLYLFDYCINKIM